MQVRGGMIVVGKNDLGENDCGCGRSPTGKCIGWHGLTNEQYKVKLNEWNQSQESGKQLLNENQAVDKA